MRRRRSPARLRVELLEDRWLPTTLTVAIAPPSFAETAGPAAATGTVTRSGADLSQPLAVSLTSSDTTEATVPATVTIPAGQASATFPIAAIDDTVFDGTQRVRITAWSDGPSPSGTVAYDPAFQRQYTSAVFQPETTIVQPDGKIVTLCRGNSTWATVTRHLPDGTPDAGFGSSGVVVLSGTGMTPRGVAVGSDGKIVIAGDPGVLARLNPDGSVDNTFGTAGRVTLDLGTSTRELRAVAVQPDGKVVASGWMTLSSGARDALVFRVNADGSLDATFGTGGRISVASIYYGDTAYGIALQPDGKVVVVGGAYYAAGSDGAFYTARYTAAGVPDDTFGNFGIVYQSLTQDYEIGTDVQVLPDGRLVIVSSTGIARYNPNGSHDITFGAAGLVKFNPAPGLSSGMRVDALPNGRIAVGGMMSTGVTFTVYGPDGTAESTATLAPRQVVYGGMAVAPDGSQLYTAVTTLNTPTTTVDRLERFALTVPPSAVGTVDVTDDDPAPPPAPVPLPLAITLAVTPGGVSEAAGAGAATGTVTRSNADLSQPLVVNLQSGNTAAATVPASVTIPAGQVSATFPITAVNNTVLDGTRSVPLVAWAGGATPAGAITRAPGFAPTFPTGTFSAGAVAVQPDGKLVVASRMANTGVQVTRLNPDGSLDAAFGSGGAASTLVTGDLDTPTAVVVQPDGRIVVGGSIWAPGSVDVFLVRFNPDGSVDPTFGTDGRVTLDLGPDQGSGIRELALLPDGKILAGGNITQGANDYALLVLRFNPDGSLDPTYGVGGRAILNPSPYQDTGYGLVARPDGRAVLVGEASTSTSSYQMVTLVQFTADGQPDPTFGVGGRVQTDLRLNKEDGARDVALMPDGRLVVAAIKARDDRGAGNNYLDDLVVVRYMPDGSIDPTFGTGGAVGYTIRTVYPELRVAVLPDNRVVVGTTTGDPTATAGLIRFSSTGVFEAADFSSTSNFVGSLLVLPDGTAYLGGTTSTVNTFRVNLDRFAAGGPPAGRATLDVFDDEVPALPPPPPPPPPAGPAPFAVSLTVSPITVREGGTATATVTRSGPLTDPLVVTMTSGNPSAVGVPATVTIPAGQASAAFAVAVADNTLADGARSVTITAATAGSQPIGLDPSFGTGGFQLLPHNQGWSSSTSGLAIQPDGKVLAAGSSPNANGQQSWLVTRSLPDGRPDYSFGVNGTATTGFPNVLPDNVYSGDANKLLVQPDGKIVVVGVAPGGFLPGEDWAVVRYNPDGSLDTTFAAGGIFRYEFPDDRPGRLSDVALLPDGRLLITGSGELSFVAARLMADGRLDPTFGVGGVAVIDAGLPGGNQFEIANNVAALPDGKVLVGGYAYGNDSGGTYRTLARLARLNPDGTPDATFGPGGVRTVPGTTMTGLTVLPDGNLLTLSRGQLGSGNTDWVLARLTPAGDPDPGFGGGDGVATLDFAGYADSPNVMAVLADGSILVGGSAYLGTSSSNVALAKYRPDGTLDPAFGQAGVFVQAGATSYSGEVIGLTVQPDGRIVTVLNTFSNGKLARFLPGTGSPPATAAVTVVDDEPATAPATLTLTLNPTSVMENAGSAAATGTVTRTGDVSQAVAVTLSADPEKLTVPTSVTIPAGQASATFTVGVKDNGVPDGNRTIPITASASLAAWTGAITADTSFGPGGSANAPPPGAMAIMPDGRVVLVGSTVRSTGNPAELTVVRLLANGSRDQSFGYTGTAYADVTAGADTAAGVAVLPDGRVLVAGTGVTPTGPALILVRYTAAGLLDPTFGTEGRVALGGGATSAWQVQGMTVDVNGKILVAGSLAGAMAVARFNPDGTADAGFGTGGVATVPATTNSLGYAVAVQPDGKVVVAGDAGGGTATSLVAVARFNPDGTRDAGFGTNGTVAVDLAGVFDGGRDLLLQPDGKIVVGGAVGRTGTSPTLYDAVLLRFNPDGTPDTGFGSGGSVVGNVGGGTGSGVSVSLQPDGRVVAAATQTTSAGASPQAWLLRFSPTGVLENTTKARSSFTTAEGVIARTDGSIYLLSLSGSSGLLDRYRSSGPVTSQAGLDIQDNEPPVVAVADSYSVAEDGHLVVAAPGVRSNDLSAPGAPAVTAELVTGPTHGTLTLGPDGAVDYRPNADYFGADTFTYHLIGTGVTSNTVAGTITVAAVNDPPTGNPDAYVMNEDGVQVPPPVTAPADLAVRYTFDEVPAGNFPPAQDSGQAPANTGTLTGRASRIGNTLGGAGATALALPTGGDGGVTAPATDLDALTEITLTLWVNMQASPAAGDMLVTNLPPSSTVLPAGSVGWSFGIGGATGPAPTAGSFPLNFSVRQYTAGGGSSTQGQTTLTRVGADAAWAFVAVTFNPSDPRAGAGNAFVTFYSGGLAGATGVMTESIFSRLIGGPGAGLLRVGNSGDASPAGGDKTPPAWLDDVRVYDRALTAAEVEAVRQEGVPQLQAGLSVIANDTDVESPFRPTGAQLVTGPTNGTLTLRPDGTFTYTPVADFYGTDSFTYRPRDSSEALGNVTTVTLTVNPVNDAPRFTPGADVTVLEDAGPQTVTGWATGIGPGAANEAGQVVTFEVVGDTNPSLFAVAPVLAADGTLTFTPAPGANGTTSVTVRLKDNGGTANGGADTSAPVTFAITLTSVPDVAGVTVNDGAAQRSRVTTLTVTFDSDVTLAAGAFTLTRPSDGAAITDGGATPQVTVNAVVVGGVTVATLTFVAVAGSSLVESGSLADGVWVLTVDRTKVTAGGVGMAADYATPASGAGRIHRLFGDSDGDGDVDALDYARARAALNTHAGDPNYQPMFDWDADGDVDALDYARVRARLNTRV